MQIIPQFNRQLLEKYDRPLPRYTSYPTALQFSEQTGSIDWIQALSQRPPNAAPFSLYFHIPFCRSLCFYCACNKIITPQHQRSLPYLNAIIGEVAQVAGVIPNEQRRVSQIHLGGGTPTFLNQQQLTDLWQAIHQNFELESDGEYSIEIDPRACSEDMIQHLAQLGFNRMSFGIQDLDPKVQRAINRIQSAQQTFAQMRRARVVGVQSINIDLIYGLPLQTPKSFSRTLDQVINELPDRIAVYGYAHMPHAFKAQRQMDQYPMPNLSEKLHLLELAIDRFTEAGYQYIGLDHFALPDDELAIARNKGDLHRNFQGYSTQKSCDMLGFGVTAIGKIGDLFYQNTKQEKSYLQRIEKQLSPVLKGYRLSQDDHVRAYTIMNLMCHGELNFDAFEQHTGESFTEYFYDCLPELAEFFNDNLVTVEFDKLQIQPLGQLLLRNICHVFDAYRQPQDHRVLLHARAV